MHDFILISGMLAVTYSVRLLPFAYAHRIQFPEWLQEALSYVPVAALTAIIAPIILYRVDQLAIGFDNPYLIASLIALVVSLKTKSLLKTVFSGLVVFFVLKQLY